MTKIRQLTTLREEINLGDLVRILCEGTPEIVGYYQRFIARSDIAIFSRSQKEQHHKGESFYVDISDGLISDNEGKYQNDPSIRVQGLTQPRATQYEILRRSKRA